MRDTGQKGFSVVEALIAVFVVGLLVGGGVFVYSQNQKKADTAGDLNSKTSNSETATNTGSDDEHADWKTYTSEKEGLSISYPTSWTFKDMKTADVFDKFTLTGPEGFVITCSIATIPLDGGEAGLKVEFVDELKDANYTKPLYVVGHYNPEYNNLDAISVTNIKFAAGETDAGPRGYFASKIVEKMDEMGSNYVLLEGRFPNYKTAEGYDASPSHKDFAAGDLKVARQILNTVKYK